uniref:Uncharacterized protein n=1 Tax=Glossina palpalis gambiensis TaxID=67801 RepID=A0A1B0AUX2_9MUSC
MYRCPGNVNGIHYLANFQRVPAVAGWPLRSSSFKLKLSAVSFLSQLCSMNGPNLIITCRKCFVRKEKASKKDFGNNETYFERDLWRLKSIRTVDKSACSRAQPARDHT